jgi:hypothetical protein
MKEPTSFCSWPQKITVRAVSPTLSYKDYQDENGLADSLQDISNRLQRLLPSDRALSRAALYQIENIRALLARQIP